MYQEPTIEVAFSTMLFAILFLVYCLMDIWSRSPNLAEAIQITSETGRPSQVKTQVKKPEMQVTSEVIPAYKYDWPTDPAWYDPAFAMQREIEHNRIHGYDADRAMPSFEHITSLMPWDLDQQGTDDDIGELSFHGENQYIHENDFNILNEPLYDLDPNETEQILNEETEPMFDPRDLVDPQYETDNRDWFDSDHTAYQTYIAERAVLITQSDFNPYLELDSERVHRLDHVARTIITAQYGDSSRNGLISNSGNNNWRRTPRVYIPEVLSDSDDTDQDNEMEQID